MVKRIAARAREQVPLHTVNSLITGRLIWWKRVSRTLSRRGAAESQDLSKRKGPVYTDLDMKDAERLRRFEDEQARASAPSYEEGLRIFEALWLEGVELGVLPPEDPLDGIEVDVKLAEMLRV